MPTKKHVHVQHDEQNAVTSRMQLQPSSYHPNNTQHMVHLPLRTAATATLRYKAAASKQATKLD